MKKIIVTVGPAIWGESTLNKINNYLEPNGVVSKYHGSLSPEKKSQIVAKNYL